MGRMGRRAKTATAENPLPLPLQFLAAWIGMWLGERQARVIEYQRAEKAALLEGLGKHRLRLTDGERRRLASWAMPWAGRRCSRWRRSRRRTPFCGGTESWGRRSTTEAGSAVPGVRGSRSRSYSCCWRYWLTGNFLLSSVRLRVSYALATLGTVPRRVFYEGGVGLFYDHLLLSAGLDSDGWPRWDYKYVSVTLADLVGLCQGLF
jgi:hypothetical protein